MKKTHVRKALVARSALVLIALSCIPIGLLVRRNIRKSVQANEWVEHTNQVLLQLENLQASANAVTAIVEGRASAIVPSVPVESLTQARTQESEELARLRCLVGDNSTQRNRIPALWQALSASSPDTDTALPPVAAAAIRQAASRQAENQEAAISRVVQTMTADERRELKDQEATLASDQNSDNHSILLLLFACAGLLALSMVATERDLRTRQKSERISAESATRLQQSVRDLEQQNQKISILNSLGTSLQLCSSEEDVFVTVEKFLRSGCPHRGGAVAITTASRNLVDVVYRWGDVHLSEFYAPVDCCALRGGKIHLFLDDGPTLRCRHLLPNSSTSLCLPLSAQGETIGVLHLELTPEQAPALHACLDDLLPSLCSAMAMSLANLRLREILRNQSIRDPLTGLYNRRYLEEMFERELRRAERHHSRVALLMLDVDHFKNFNDSYGHEAGDIVLKELGAALRNAFREEDVVCRYGGEEFAIVLADVGGGAAIPVAEKLIEQVHRLEPRLNGNPLPSITVSGGLAEYPADATDATHLVRIADQRLYEAKRSGRNRIITSIGTLHGDASAAEPR